MPVFIQRDVFQLRELPAILSDVVSATWRGGDRRPEGAEAPPRPNARPACGTAEGRRPMTRGREGGEGDELWRNDSRQRGLPQTG